MKMHATRFLYSACTILLALTYSRAAQVAKSDQGDARADAPTRNIVDAVAANIGEHYFDRDVARKTADALLAHERAGDDDGAKDGEALAALLTRQMRETSHDMHLEAIYSRDPLPMPRGEPTAEERARRREFLLGVNCGIDKAEMLPQGIGYFKFDAFAETEVCAPAVRKALAGLNDASALILDLRDNRGGQPDMVMLIAAYLFDHPEYIYNPREAPSESSWTRPPVEGNKLADKPVYVLTSKATWSAAEDFAYNLKMERRATLVGETTGGGAHAGAFHRIDDHFAVAIPEVKAVNPFGSADWEGVGVEPDVKVRAGDALETATKLALSGMAGTMKQ